MITEPQIADNAPWKQRYRAPQILWTQLADEAPHRGLACSNRSGVYQLHTWNVGSGEVTQLTTRASGMVFGYMSPDGKYVYYLDDKLGNEIGHFVRVPFGGGDPEDISPSLPPYASWSLNVSRASNMVAFTWAGQDGFHLTAIVVGKDGKLGDARELFHTPKLAGGQQLSRRGEVVAINSTERTQMLHFGIIAIDTVSGERIGELWEGEDASVEAVTFSPIEGDLRILALTNRMGVQRPLLWNPRTGERKDLDLRELQGDVTAVDWSPDGKRLLLCNFNQAVQQLYIYDLDGDKLVKLNHPSGTFAFFGELGTYFGPDGQIYAQWQDSMHPSQLIALDAQTGEKVRTVLAAGDVPTSRPWKSINFKSSDGQQIQGWLAVPEGEGPFPTILHTHGGPEAVITEMYMVGSQAWLDHGFAFLTINYRGSTTFGKEFQEKIWGNPGRWEVEDMVAARNWLVDQGIAKSDQIFVTGGSYGGYLTLLPLGVRPELDWAGGMGMVAIADWKALYEDSADTLRGYQIGMFGGPPEQMPEQYAASSPITYAEEVRAPLLIIQGRNDTRCPDRQMEMYVAKMEELGKPIEVHWFNAGHGSYSVEEQIEHQQLMLQFAYRVLSGQLAGAGRS
jgi:acetyl esterase/lipase